MSLVVYTAIADGYDPLRQPPPRVRGDATFVAFLDRPAAMEPWDIRPLAQTTGDATRDAKRPKILPHEFFPDVEYSLWVDGKIELVMPSPVTQLLQFLRDADLAVFEHPLRYCLYQEACECVHRRLDDPDVIYRQVFRYTREGFPANAGLIDANVILRRHTPAMDGSARRGGRRSNTGPGGIN